MKLRLAPAVAAFVSLLALLAGCGGGSSSSDIAGMAPPGVPVFVEGTVRPSGQLKSNTDALAQKIGGIDNLGEFVVEQLESSARSEGESFDYEKEVKPWLGERAGLFFEKLEEGNLSKLGVMVASTDTNATQEFVDAQVRKSKSPYAKKSYEGVEYEYGGDEEDAVGVVGEYLVIADDEATFHDIVDASNGESLGDESRFTDAVSAATDGSLADVYVDVGGLIEESGGKIDAQARQLLQGAGIDPSEATAVASIVPHSENIEVDLSSDLGGEKAPSGNASDLLGSLPAGSFAAFAVSGFGEQLQEALDNLDAEGVPGTIPPHQLKKGLKQLGIDLEGIAGSLEDAGAFAVGNSERSLGGALVLTTSNSKAMESVANVGKLLRSVHVSGVTALSGKVNGFTVRNAELGDKPLVVAAKEKRLAIGYGLPATLTALASEPGKTLSDDPGYREAVSALGGTPISLFVDGPAALNLATSLVPRSDRGFQKAKRYLKAISFLALGSATEGELASAKLIVGIEK